MNLIELSETFPEERDAVMYFEKVRWGDVPLCAYCDSPRVSKLRGHHRRKCAKCNKSFSVTTGTNLHHTRIPLKTWLYAFSVISDAKKGLSALQLQRNLSISYPTAFKMYHAIRGFMSWETNQPDQLDEIVEMDETYIGGKPRKGANSKCLPVPKKKELDVKIKKLKKEGYEIKAGNRSVACDTNVKRGRGTKKIPVVGIVERDGDVVAEVMRNLTYNNLRDMVKKYVEEDKAVLITDELPSYNKMNQIIEHIKIDHKQMYSYRGINTNSIESFWAIIKRGIMGQYHHVTLKYLPNYVAEFVFKYNNRKDDEMFELLVRNAINDGSREKKVKDVKSIEAKQKSIGRAMKIVKEYEQDKKKKVQKKKRKKAA